MFFEIVSVKFDKMLDRNISDDN